MSTHLLDPVVPHTHRNVMITCIRCHESFDELMTRCPCGGMTETSYDRVAYPAADRPGFFERFWPVLPLRDITNLPHGLDLSSRTIRADEVRSVVGGPELWLKDESRLPTHSTKARVGAVVFPFLREHGIREFVAASTGNTSTAIAWMARHFPDMCVHLFVGRDFVPRLRHVTSPNVSVHVQDGTFVEAGRAAQRFADRHDLFWEAGFFNPARRDGLKTAFIEAALDMGRAPETYVQAVSSAMGVIGAAKGATELPAFGLPAAAPRLVCIQQKSCAPMVNAWNAGSPVIRPVDRVDEPTGVAEAILRGDPSGAYPPVHDAVRASAGTFRAVSSGRIRRAQALLRGEGVLACEAGATALAGYARLVRDGWFRDDDGPVLVNVTGGPRNDLREG